MKTFFIVSLCYLLIQCKILVLGFRPLLKVQQASLRFDRMYELHAKKKHKVTIQHEGKDTVLEVAEDYSILNAALDAGIELPYDCNLGVCLTCPARVVSGTIDATGSTLDDSVQELGFALTCCSFPRSDVVIRSIDEDELVNAQFKR